MATETAPQALLTAPPDPTHNLERPTLGGNAGRSPFVPAASKENPMNVFRTIWAALERLGTNLHALADTVGLTNHQLRERLMLDDGQPPAELLEGKAQSLPASAPVPNGKAKRIKAESAGGV